MARGVLTDEVKDLMVSLGFKGLVTELRLMPYLIGCLLDNRYPIHINSEEHAIIKEWKDKSWVTGFDRTSGFSVTENLFDRMFKVAKLGYCSDVMEKTNHKVTVIFEGPDGSGKSSIMDSLWNDKDLHEYCIFDRSFISDFVYAKKFDRTSYKGVSINTYYDYWSNYYAYNKELKVVLCTADEHILYDRCKAKLDPIVTDKDKTLAMLELLADDNLFKNYTHMFCKDFNIPMLILDTTNDSLEQSVDKAKKFILGEER